MLSSLAHFSSTTGRCVFTTEEMFVGLLSERLTSTNYSGVDYSDSWKTVINLPFAHDLGKLV